MGRTHGTLRDGGRNPPREGAPVRGVRAALDRSQPRGSSKKLERWWLGKRRTVAVTSPSAVRRAASGSAASTNARRRIV